MTKNDRAWQRVFDGTFVLQDIQRNGFAYLTATQLKQYGKREPRLMAKQDTLSVRPAPFKRHKLSIFPVRNGKYVLFPDPGQRSYFDFGSLLADLPVEEFRPAVDLTAYVSFRDAHFSESQAIDYAFLAGVLQAFTGEEQLSLTIRGRLRSGEFAFRLPENGRRIAVSGVQIEVDAGYESEEALVLVEAKIGKRANFHIRQLYYPWLEWSRRTGKRIIPVFLTYTNGKYYFTRFAFGDDFGGVRAVGSRCYTVNESPVTALDLTKILHDQPVGREPDVPYPQANDLDKVLDLVSLVHRGYHRKRFFADFFEMDERQGDYYANAGVYLGLLRKRGDRFLLTREGRSFAALDSRTARTGTVVAILARRPSFRELFRRWHSEGSKNAEPTREDIAGIIQKHTHLSGTTPVRRASTVAGWLEWIGRNCLLE